jgi:hypothetical protein
MGSVSNASRNYSVDLIHVTELERVETNPTRPLKSEGDDDLLPKGSDQLISSTAVRKDGQQSFLAGLSFGNMGGDLMNLQPSFSQEPQIWSPVESDQACFSHLPSAFEDFSQDTEPFDVASVHGSFMHSAAPSLAEAPLLSTSFSNNWTMASNSNRSSSVSYGSSLRTWGTDRTDSTYLSTGDIYSEDQKETDFTIPADKSIDPSRLSKKPTFLPSRFSTSKSIPEEDGCGSFSHAVPPKNHSSFQTHSKRERNPTKDSALTKPVPSIPQKADRGHGKYICTVCSWRFPRKGDWERHEESQHDPQTYWMCMLDNQTTIQIQTDEAVGHGAWVCIFCKASKQNRDEMTVHLLQMHKINPCFRKAAEQRTWARKDKLKQHLQQVHALSESSNLWEHWQYPAKKKYAWGCGFCGACSFTWEGRLSHVASHYENQSLQISQWSQSLVIKGLLKQFQPSFNIAATWKALGGTPDWDRPLEWSKRDAEALKRKLEYHEGSAQTLAAEARRLAKGLDVKIEESGWSAPDSRTATLTSPIPFEAPMEKPWPEHFEMAHQQASFLASLGQTDVEMQDQGIPYF